ncbi:MAG: AAA family ATPase [Marinilabilia sp.]
MSEIIFPNHLYGRDREISKLLESFEHAGKGFGQIVFIPGSAGIGKTALVGELREPVKARNGFFVSGKFEQFQQNVPYFAFRQAMTELSQFLHASDDSEARRIKNEIVRSVGSLGQVLIDFVPEFEFLLGKQPPLAEISPQEARYRFAGVFRDFLQVICRPEHPLVLFIDDWQWADAASCELLRQLEVGSSLRYVVLIASYRDDELYKGHPFLSAIHALKRKGEDIQTLQLKNIAEEDVLKLISDVLEPKVLNKTELASLVFSKTSGNPFFVRSFIDYLFRFQLLWFDKQRQIWNWKIPKDVEEELPLSLVDLFANRLRKFHPDQQYIFFLAACLGNVFELQVLSFVGGMSPKECFEILFSGEGHSLLLTEEKKVKKEIQEASSTGVKCRFLHDKVQQAAFNLTEADKVPVILLGIGRKLLSCLNGDQFEEYLFEIVNDLNSGYHLIEDDSEKVRVVELNLLAAQKAFNATAYTSALLFCRAATRHIEDSNLASGMWKHHHSIITELFNTCAVCEFLEGDKDLAEAYIRESVGHSKSTVEKAKALNILIIHYTLQARYSEAIEYGREALGALGVKLPVEDFDSERDREIQFFRQQLDDKDVSSLFDLPEMTNPEMLMASNILITMGPPCYRSHQKLWSVLVPKVMNLTLRYGNIPQVGYSHTGFGGLLLWVDDDHETARALGEVATNLMTSKFTSSTHQSIFYLMIGSSLRHWFHHLRYSSDDYTDAYEIGFRSGNLQYAAYAFGHNMYCRFYQGISLETLITETNHSLEFSKSRSNQWAIDLMEGGLNIFRILTSENVNPSHFPGWNDKNLLDRIEENNNIQVKCIYNVLKTFSLFILGYTEEAFEMSEQTRPLIYTVGTQGLLPWPEFVCNRFFILTSLWDEATPESRKARTEELKQNLEKIELWAQIGPENYQHKYYLALAEMARIENRGSEAVAYYDHAIRSARDGGFIQWEGWANERACHFWKKIGNQRLSDVYRQQAYLCFKLWGATSKVIALEKDYQRQVEKSLKDLSFVDNNLTLDDEQISSITKRQVDVFRDYARQMQQSKLRVEAETQADELALATRQLRIEIAERKKAEDEISTKNKELQTLNATKDKFFSIISHDLRNPFNSILGFSDLLVETLMNGDAENGLKFGEIIKDSANRAFDLLTNLTEWAMSQTGRMDYKPNDFDLQDVVEEVIPLYKDIALQKGVNIKTEINEPYQIYADRAMLATILRNLISNAIKFSKSGGEVMLSIQKQNDEMLFSVSDTGTGISPGVQKKLFGLEEILSTEGTQAEKGTGLGLILCKEFVDRHKGEIWVESRENEGTTFYFTIPGREDEEGKKYSSGESKSSDEYFS